MRYRIILAFLLLPFSLCAEKVPVDKAKTVARNFLLLQSDPGVKGSGHLQLIPLQFLTTRDLYNNSAKKSTSTEEDLIYLFQINVKQGFILVSGDDNATPILGYSFASIPDVFHMPDNFRKWIEEYKNQIRSVKSNPGMSTAEIKDQWERLLSGKNLLVTKSTIAVEPLVSTQWNQAPYYNDMCPYDTELEEKSVTGCVATAMAQIMKYWDYPRTGNGFHSYNHSSFGLLSANFGSTVYNWESMPDVLTGENNAVATLMFHCGVSVEMDYSANSSGAYVILSESPVEHCSEYAFKEYFGYDESLTGVARDNNYSTEEWIQLLKTELEAGRPVEYAGFGTTGGHAFVCDGFDANDFFHFNWGWGGYFDGYFAIDALDPEGTGTGGGSGGYNSGHQVVIGIRPPEATTEFDLALYDSLTISNNPLLFTNHFSVHMDVANFGDAPFTGDFCAAIFDLDNNFVDFAGIFEEATLNGGMHYKDGLTFSNPGSLEMLPGYYFAEAFYRPTDGNWKVIGDGSYSNYLYFEVYYASDIELYKDFVISTGNTITQNEPFTVTADILNDGNSTFHGSFSIDLYDMDGKYTTEVQQLDGAELEPGYFYPDVIFSSGGVTVDPGTYLMALLHKPDGGDWTLSGSSYYSNPIKVIVKESPLEPDIYEVNDSVEIRYMLPLIFSDDYANISTEGSNSHVGDDIDFYGIALEEGYNYTLIARTHDSYNSGNQELYTNDVIWAYYSGNDWSEVYDDVMPGSIEIPGGGEVLFVVAPYFEGETGTYLLEISVSRTGAIFADSPEENYLKIYPNPVNDLLNIEGTSVITRIKITDAKGRMIQSAYGHSENISLDLSNLTGGIYFLHIIQQDHTATYKIVKQ